MSRTAASYSMRVTRGSTWEDVFTYTEDDQTPIDLTGYQARMQVRTVAGQYGLTGSDSLVMELTTANGRLFFDPAEDGVLRIRVEAADTLPLNPDNLRKVKHVYSLELFRPAGLDPEYVVPLVAGSISVLGEVTR